MGDNLPLVKLIGNNVNHTITSLSAYNGPCAVIELEASASRVVKCWGPNGYGSLGLVSCVEAFVFRERFVSATHEDSKSGDGVPRPAWITPECSTPEHPTAGGPVPLDVYPTRSTSHTSSRTTDLFVACRKNLP